MTVSSKPTVDSAKIVENLKQQIIEKREQQKNDKRDVNAIQDREADEINVIHPSDSTQHMGQRDEFEESAHDQEEQKRKAFKFSKGDQNFEVDEDAEFEFVADKRPMKMTLREMRDAAAGGVAVRNRMRQLAEERKSLLEPYKEFTKVSREDPLGALEKMFKVIKNIDPDADFNEFLQDLASQAQNVAQMEPSARKAYQLERQLKDKETRLSEAEKMSRIGELKQELMEQTGLSEDKVYEFGQHILTHPVLSETVENEEDLMERIGDLAAEVELQTASYQALRKHNANMSPQDPIIFELSNLLRQNPDFDEQDLEDIAAEVMGSVQKAKASQKLSKRHRAVSGLRSSNDPPDYHNMKPVEALRLQIENKKKQQHEQQKLTNKRI